MRVKDVILCLLLEGPLSGYDIKKKYETEYADYIDVKMNNIYTSLAALQSSGHVDHECIDQHSRPNKKNYFLTDLGRRTALAALLKSEARHQIKSDFLFLISFSAFMPKTRIKQLINQRLQQLSMLLVTHSMRSHTGQNSEEEIFVEGMIEAAIKAEIEFIVNKKDELLDSRKPDATRTKLTKDEIIEAALTKGRKALT